MGATGPKVIGNFEVLAKLGQGGMGAVFKARQISLDRIVALKILPPSIAKNERFIERFQREARASAKLNHPNIVQGIDVGFDEAAGLWYFAMEFVDGPTVKKVLDEQKVLDEKQALEIARDIAQALVCAEKNGIVHRDIKPDNILLNNRGEAKLADLGLAKQTQDDASVTQTGMAIGTPYYMAPEQARGDTNAIDFRTDLYALGATLFHLVTGEPLFSGTTGAVIMTKHITEKPRQAHRVNLNVSEATGRLVNRLVQKEPSKRYQSAGDVLAAIDKILSQGVTTGPRAPVGSGSGRHAAIRGGTTGRLPPVRGMPTAQRTTPEVGAKSGPPKVLYAGLGGALLLGVVVFLFLGGSPPRTNPANATLGPAGEAPEGPEKSANLVSVPAPGKLQPPPPSPPLDTRGKAPPPDSGPSPEQVAFNAMSAALAEKAPDDKAGRRALLDAFLKAHDGSVEGARARVLLSALDKLEAAPPGPAVSAEVTPAPLNRSGSAALNWVGRDYKTKGNWKGVWGADGYSLAAFKGDRSGDVKPFESDLQALPPYVAEFKKTGVRAYVWSLSSKAQEALASPDGTARKLTQDLHSSHFEYRIRFSDRKPHRISVYVGPGNNNDQAMQVEVIEAASGTVLNAQQIQQFGMRNGLYLSWDVLGEVVVRFTKLSGANASCAGIFFDPTPEKVAQALLGSAAKSGVVPAANPPQAQTPAVEAKAPAAVAGEAAYAAFLDPFLAELREWNREAAAQRLAKAAADPKLGSYRDRLAADRKALAWMEQIEGAVAKGAETLKDVESFTLYTTDDKPTKIGRKETSKLFAVEEGKLQIDIGGGQAPLPFKVLSLRTKRELAQRGLPANASGKVLAAWMSVLSLGTGPGAPDAAQAKAAIDAAAQGGAAKDDIGYLTERLAVMERSAKDVAADRAWDEVKKLTEKGKEQWKPLLQALKDFEAAHAGTAPARAHAQEAAALHAEAQRMVDLLDGYYFDFKTEQNFEAFKRLFSAPTGFGLELAWRDGKAVYRYSEADARFKSGQLHLQAADVKYGRFWSMKFQVDLGCSTANFTPGRHAFMVRFVGSDGRIGGDTTSHHRFHLEMVGGFNGFLCCALRNPGQFDNGGNDKGGIFGGMQKQGLQGGGYQVPEPRPPVRADGVWDIELEMRGRHFKAVANGTPITDEDLSEDAARWIEKSPLAIWVCQSEQGKEVLLHRFFFKARTPDEAQAGDAQPEAPRVTPAGPAREPGTNARPGLPPPEKRLAIAVLGSSEQTTNWQMKSAFQNIEIDVYDKWTKDHGGGVVAGTCGNYGFLAMKGRGAEVKAGTTIGFEIYNGAKETIQFQPRISLTKSGRLGDDYATAKDFFETNAAELKPGESGTFFGVVPERDAGNRSVLTLAFAVGTPALRSEGVQLKNIWYALPEDAAGHAANDPPSATRSTPPAAGAKAGTYQAEWTKLELKGAKPIGLHFAGTCMTYDTKRHRFVYLGGSVGDKAHNDLWAFDPNTQAWSELKRIEGGNEALKTVSGRYNHLIYDPNTDLYWLSTGMAYNPSTDAWSSVVENFGKDAQWPRIRGPWALDAQNGRLLGAYWTGDATGFCKAWLTHTRAGKYEDLPDSNVPFRYYVDGGLAYDSKNRVFVLFGGSSGKASLDDTWVFDPQRKTWTELPVKQRPPTRAYYHLIYYEAIESMVLFGGAGLGGELTDLWVLDTATQQWVEAQVAGEPNLSHLAAAYSPEHKLVLGQNSHADTWVLRVSKR